MSARALVVGAGPAGLAAAHELSSWCGSVTVVDARPRERRHAAGEHLPPPALRSLAAAGLARELQDGRHEPSPGVRSVWGAATPVDKDYFAGLPSRGLNLRREHFDEALARRAEQTGAVLEFGVRLARLRRDGRGYHAALRGPDGTRTARVDVVIDASGRRAVAARALGARRRRFDGLVGLVGRVESCPPCDELGRVHIEAVEDGWWYAIRLSDGSMLAAFMTDAGLIRAHPGTAPELWKARLDESPLLAPLAGGGRWSGRIAAFDAATQTLERGAFGGFLAVGDAAAAYDPLSSWGITKAVLDGRAGAAALGREWRGERGALAAHRTSQAGELERHRARQRDFYRAEARWPTSPFWRVRQRAPRPTAPHEDHAS